MKYTCKGCGEEVYSDNEDDVVVGLCGMCQDFGSDYAEELGEGRSEEYCSCEDYPCCGH